MIWNDLSLGIPAYGRPRELEELLTSVAALPQLPREIVICEDMSPQRAELASIAEGWSKRFAQLGCSIRFVENEENLGYDGNVRQVIRMSRRNWTMLLGNDDFLINDAVGCARNFVETYPKINVVSRAYERVLGRQAIGVSRQSTADRVFSKSDCSSGMIFRLCGFVGGLMINTQWAIQREVDTYDGTLFYQIYLAAEGFADTGIGYIATPIVGARTGNPPLFGSAKSEKTIHLPGSYTPAARAAMWRGVEQIARDVERRSCVPLWTGLRRELTVRQSFHVFEMMSQRNRRDTIELVILFRRLNLMSHPIPWGIALIAFLFGRCSIFFFRLVRNLAQTR